MTLLYNPITGDLNLEIPLKIITLKKKTMQNFHIQHDPACKLISIQILFLNKYARQLGKCVRKYTTRHFKKYFLKKVMLFCTFMIPNTQKSRF